MPEVVLVVICCAVGVSLGALADAVRTRPLRVRLLAVLPAILVIGVLTTRVLVGEGTALPTAIFSLAYALTVAAPLRRSRSWRRRPEGS